MKYFVMIGDGMADYKIESLGNKTPLEAADKPTMDYLAQHGQNGRAVTVPEGMVPESDTANLAILGYDPKIYSKGRSPLEAMSMGLEMSPSQYAFRCNVVTLSDEEDYDSKVMLDHSSGEITTEEADELIRAIDAELGNDIRRFYTGVSYRHCMLWDNPPGYTENERIYDFARPHDIIGQQIGKYIPSGDIGEKYGELMRKSYHILKDHPINQKRREEGKNPANSIWLWSPGKKPQLPNFKAEHKLDGSVISAVDLIKGIGICAGMESIDVEGATGNYKTNYIGKADAAIDAFKRGRDLVYLHVEGPDECGHCGEADTKVLAIEKIDRLILAKVKAFLDESGEDYKILLMPDHYTPVKIRTHAYGEVPFVIYDSRKELCEGIARYTEDESAKSPLLVEDGYKLIGDLFIEK